MNKEKLNELEAADEKLFKTQNKYYLVFNNIIPDFIALYTLYFECKGNNDYDKQESYYDTLFGFMKAVDDLHRSFKRINDVDVNNVLMLINELYRDIEHDYFGG